MKGESDRIDNVLDHMLDAMMQMLENRGLFEALRQQLYAFDV
jgi:hypothetical protein